MRQTISLSELTRCEPAGAVSHEGRPGTWIAVDCEVDEGKGVMLFGLPGSAAPELTLRLGVTAWYAIPLGIFYGASAGFIEDRVLCARLSNDASFSRFGREDFRLVKDGDSRREPSAARMSLSCSGNARTSRDRTWLLKAGTRGRCPGSKRTWHMFV